MGIDELRSPEGGRHGKKKPAGAMDGPAGLKKWRGQDSNL